MIVLKMQSLQVSERANIQRANVHTVSVKIVRVAETPTDGVNCTLYSHLSPRNVDRVDAVSLRRRVPDYARKVGILRYVYFRW